MDNLRQLNSPQTVIGRFVARRTFRAAIIWAMVFGVFVASKAIGYAAAYPTEDVRLKLAATFQHNVGLNVIFGVPSHIESVAGFTVWNTLGVMVIIGAIWGFLTATRVFRGEEESGRSELLLVGQTTPRRAAVNTFLGLGFSLLVLFLVASITFALVGRGHNVNYGIADSLFFAFAASAGALEFITVGAFASQIMPTRAKAAAMCMGIFGISFFTRAMADITSARWLLNISPLGWIEKLQPVMNPRPIWIVPIVCFAFFFASMAVWFAGRRDWGSSIIADKDTAKPHTNLLHSPFGMALRLTRATTIGWVLALTVMSAFFGLLTSTATQIYSDGGERVTKVLEQFAGGPSNSALATLFLSIVFLMLATVMMCYAGSSVSAMRNDEAQGYLDNLLVRPVSRVKWLLQRVAFTTLAIGFLGIWTGFVVWLSESSQGAGVSFGTIFPAGLNAIAPTILALGIGVFAFGVLPRLTSVIAYGIVAWSFLIQMVSSGINLNHWVQDTAIFYHIALVPAADPRWDTNIVLISLAVVLATIGMVVFTRRDLQSE